MYIVHRITYRGCKRILSQCIDNTLSERSVLFICDSTDIYSLLHSTYESELEKMLLSLSCTANIKNLYILQSLLEKLFTYCCLCLSSLIYHTLSFSSHLPHSVFVSCCLNCTLAWPSFWVTVRILSTAHTWPFCCSTLSSALVVHPQDFIPMIFDHTWIFNSRGEVTKHSFIQS